MPWSWTSVQTQRLRELGAPVAVFDLNHATVYERDRSFCEIHSQLSEKAREDLEKLRSTRRRPRLSLLDTGLAAALVGEGFVQVITPITLGKGLLARMSITEGHPLYKQVYWLGGNRCLRPMLAPNLYYLLRDLVRLWEKPVRIFEIGPCFRKESRGASHLSEFTMLNLVEVGNPEVPGKQRIKDLAGLVMEVAGIPDYQLRAKKCVVYGKTIDVVVKGVEVGSGVVGPHPIDSAWGIMDAWVGIGFGLERLLMAREGDSNIARYGRSLVYLDGARLDV